jgi:hypothetical protein
MEMWKNVFNLKISWDLAVLGRVIRKRGRFLVPSEEYRRVV